MQEDEFKQRSMNTVYIVASGYTLDSIVQVYCIHGLMHTLALHLFTMATATLLGHFTMVTVIHQGYWEGVISLL